MKIHATYVLIKSQIDIFLHLLQISYSFSFIKVVVFKISLNI